MWSVKEMPPLVFWDVNQWTLQNALKVSAYFRDTDVNHTSSSNGSTITAFAPIDTKEKE